MEIEIRKKRLERDAFVSDVESKAIALNIGDSRTFRIKDIESYQRIRTRFNTLKKLTGRQYLTELDGNILKVIRSEDKKDGDGEISSKK